MKTPNDTLLLDTTLIAQWRKEGIDYTQEFAEENSKQEDKTHSTIDFPFDKWFRALMPATHEGQLFGAVVMVVIVVVTLIILLRKKFEAPVQRVTLGLDEEDTIYGVDFTAALRTAEEDRNYVQCIRLRYLQLLRYLHDRQKIYWLPGKTSTQYVNEVGLAPFASLTQTFVRVRYGKYPADEVLYAELKGQAHEVELLVDAAQVRNPLDGQPQNVESLNGPTQERKESRL